tara:strand:+ start:1925 stop:2152 length:228 start_codon:yes stop_codon:yes gene_type:complete
MKNILYSNLITILTFFSFTYIFNKKKYKIKELKELKELKEISCQTEISNKDMNEYLIYKQEINDIENGNYKWNII